MQAAVDSTTIIRRATIPFGTRAAGTRKATRRIAAARLLVSAITATAHRTNPWRTTVAAQARRARIARPGPVAATHLAEMETLIAGEMWIARITADPTEVSIAAATIPVRMNRRSERIVRPRTTTTTVVTRVVAIHSQGQAVRNRGRILLRVPIRLPAAAIQRRVEATPRQAVTMVEAALEVAVLLRAAVIAAVARPAVAVEAQATAVVEVPAMVVEAEVPPAAAAVALRMAITK